MSLLEKIRKNPYISFPIYGITRNGIHRKYYRQFEKTSTWDKDTISDWQFQKVKEMVEYAYHHVKFYRDLYNEHGFHPRQLLDWDDYEKIPCIDKKIIKEKGSLCYSDECEQIGYRFDYTGGSTGQPMKFMIDNDIYQREDAAYRFYWGKIGFNVGDKCVVLRGKKIYTPSHQFVYEYNRFWNYMYLDSAHLEEKLLPQYIDAIRKFDAKVIQAYPSSLLLLARLCESYDIEVPSFSLILLGSENVDTLMIKEIKDKYKCQRVFNQYGHSEKAVLALQTPSSDLLAFVPTYGYAELVDAKGVAIRDEDCLGEIVATGFSKSMPFIRYKTNDMAYWVDEETNDYMNCWRKIKGIEGRLHEFIITNTGRQVSICTIGGAHISELNEVIDMQYEQNVPGELTINVLSKNVLDKKTKKMIEKKYEQLFDGEMRCFVNQVESLVRTSRNKKVMLINSILETDGGQTGV